MPSSVEAVRAYIFIIFMRGCERLSRIYSEDIEIKVFVGNSSLRRQFTKANNIPIAKINSGLPLKGENDKF